MRGPAYPVQGMFVCLPGSPQPAEDTLRVFVLKSGSLREISRLILPAARQQQLHIGLGKPIEFVDGAQNTEPRCEMLFSTDADRFHDTIKNFPIIHLHHIRAARNPQSLHRIRGHHAHFGVGGGRGRPDRVGVELHELAEAAGAGLLVAKHPADAIGAIGLRQRVEIFRDITGERRGQIIAQRQPLLVVVLKGEHALIGPVLVGQEFAERVGIFDGRSFDRLKPVALIDLADRLQHPPGCGDLSRAAIVEPARPPCLELVVVFALLRHRGPDFAR